QSPCRVHLSFRDTCPQRRGGSRGRASPRDRKLAWLPLLPFRHSRGSSMRWLAPSAPAGIRDRQQWSSPTDLALSKRQRFAAWLNLRCKGEWLPGSTAAWPSRSEEHTSELQSRENL